MTHTVQVPEALYQALEKVAERHEVRVADVVRRACRLYLTERGDTATFAEAAELRRKVPA